MIRRLRLGLRLGAPDRVGGYRRAGLLLALAAAASFAPVPLLQGAALNPVSAMLTDAFQRLAPRPYDPETPVRIVAIDEESLERFGQWPWPRPYLAELAQRLNALGAAAIAFDLLLAEPDRTSPEIVQESERRFDFAAPRVPRLVETTRHDARLARAIAPLPVVLGALPSEPDGTPPVFPRKFGLAVVGGDPRPRLPQAEDLDAPLAALANAAEGLGIAGVQLARGGVVRRATLFSVAGGEIAPSIALEALRVAQQERNYVLRSSDAGGEAGGAAPALVSIRVGGVEAPVGADGRVWLRFSGPHPARFVPAWRVLEGVAPDADLRREISGRIVLVGATAPGLASPVSTPLDAAIWPVEAHAEALEQLILGATLRRPDWAPGAEALAVVLLGGLCVAAVMRASAVAGAAAAALLAAAPLAGAWIAFREAGLVLDPAPALGAVASAHVTLTALHYLTTRLEGAAVRAQFERFVSPAVIQDLVADPELRRGLAARQRELTVMFCDARGFTTISESMPSDRLIGYLNTCFGALTEAVLAHGGTIDKYMGDAIMAFWNAPLDTPDHAERALAAAFAIRAAQTRLNAEFAAQGLPTVEFGVGLNSGLCSVGLMGGRQRLEYSCVGDAVNIASRLQDLTKVYGVWNLFGAPTAAALRGWETAPLDLAPIRGRGVAVEAWTALAPAGAAPPGLARFRAALAEARSALERDPFARGPAGAALAALRAAPAPGVDLARLVSALSASAAARAA